MILLILYIGILFLAELIGSVIGALPSFLIHLLAIPIFLAQYVQLRDWPLRRALLPLALVSMSRVLSFTVPTSTTPLIFWHALIGAPLLGALVLAIYTLRLRPAEVGLSRRGLLFQLVIGLTGVPLGIVAYLLVRPNELTTVPLEVVFTIFSLFVFSALVEELLYRGLLQTTLCDTFGHLAPIPTAALFASMYIGVGSVPYLIFLFLVGLFFGWAADRSKSIVGVTLAHGLISTMALLVLPLLPL